MRVLTLTTSTVTNRGTIRGGAFVAARNAASILMSWLLKSGRVPRVVVQ